MNKGRRARLRRWGLITALAVASGSILSTTEPPAPAEAAYGAMIEPVTGYVTGFVNNRCPGNGPHDGIDITRGGIDGTPIKAAYGGTVTRSGRNGGYGNAVEISHPSGYTTVYAHMKYDPGLSSGGSVGKGSTIGYVGNTGNSFGSHLHFEVKRYGTNIGNSLGYWCGKNVTQGAAIPYSFPGLGSAPFDINFDGNSDLTAVRNDGYLVNFLGNGTGGTTAQVGGPGWDTSLAIVHGDYTNDGGGDLIQIRNDGSFHFYIGNGGGTFTHNHTGSGWTGYALLAGGLDFSLDGNADFVARAPNGDLHLYPGNGKGGFLAPRFFSSNWTGITALTAGDFNGDRRGDLVARNSAGNLYIYFGTASAGLTSAVQIGNGWNGFTLIGGGDYNNDGFPDLLGRRLSDQTLWIHPGNGAGGFSGSTQIGSGWGAYRLIV